MYKTVILARSLETYIIRYQNLHQRSTGNLESVGLICSHALLISSKSSRGTEFHNISSDWQYANKVRKQSGTDETDDDILTPLYHVHLRMNSKYLLVST